ncbi:TVAZ2 protein, partial [Polypterus senegalus]
MSVDEKRMLLDEQYIAMYKSPMECGKIQKWRLNVVRREWYSNSGAIGLITSDSVTNNKRDVVGTEGRTVRLQCSYSTSNSYTYLFWYRKYPSEAMQYILVKGARSANTEEDTAAFAQERFSSTTGQDFTVLTISSLSLSDSAIYYCALQSTMFHSAEALSKNCITTDGRDSNFKQSNVAN